LQRSVERLQELLEEVLDQASLEKMNQAQEVADSLEAEIKERKKRDTEMRDLASCEDNIFYLQTCDAMSSPLECSDLPTVQVNSDATFDPVREAVLALRDRVEDLCNHELGKITKQGLRGPDVRSRDTPRGEIAFEFNAKLRMASISTLFRSHRQRASQATPVNNTAPAEGNPYSVILTLDPNTAHKRLVLSEGNTKATLQGPTQPYHDTPQRFDGWTQVMCQSPLHAQRSYWEAEWRGRGSSMGVAYGALSRKGTDARSGLGYNAQSWTLELSDTCCLAMHDNQKRDIPVTYSPRLGIYVDLSAGTLAFYSVADNMTHLHSFRANFTQPLYATFGVGSGVGVGLDFALGQFTSSSDTIKICPL
ncbi:hypothetical protein GOODEAATRI_014864, partial [Goodea atripinnis]